MTHTDTPWTLESFEKDCGFHLSLNGTKVAFVYPKDVYDNDQDKLAAAILHRLNAHEGLVEALRAAKEHLEYIGYGDSYEREGAFSQELPEQIDSVLAKEDTHAKS